MLHRRLTAEVCLLNALDHADVVPEVAVEVLLQEVVRDVHDEPPDRRHVCAAPLALLRDGVHVADVDEDDLARGVGHEPAVVLPLEPQRGLASPVALRDALVHQPVPLGAHVVVVQLPAADVKDVLCGFTFAEDGLPGLNVLLEHRQVAHSGEELAVNVTEDAEERVLGQRRQVELLVQGNRQGAREVLHELDVLLVRLPSLALVRRPVAAEDLVHEVPGDRVLVEEGPEVDRPLLEVPVRLPYLQQPLVVEGDADRHDDEPEEAREDRVHVLEGVRRDDVGRTETALRQGPLDRRDVDVGYLHVLDPGGGQPRRLLVPRDPVDDQVLVAQAVPVAAIVVQEQHDAEEDEHALHQQQGLDRVQPVVDLPVVGHELHDAHQAEDAEEVEAPEGPVGAPELVEQPVDADGYEDPVQEDGHEVQDEPRPQVADDDAREPHLHVELVLVAGEEQPDEVHRPVDRADNVDHAEDDQVREGHGAHRYQHHVIQDPEGAD
mmetsp:Transcript_103318/g.292731  ORF Transcript_103318/g.292731 Transcript_103318/m.292731 type:complete len:493 (+) Transcript_103318:257-1735(+)